MSIKSQRDKQNVVYPCNGIADCQKRNKALVHAITLMDCENIISERSQTERPHIVGFHFYKIFKIFIQVNLKKQN